jgi:hypothetical protein
MKSMPWKFWINLLLIFYVLTFLPLTLYSLFYNVSAIIIGK